MSFSTILEKEARFYPHKDEKDLSSYAKFGTCKYCIKVISNQQMIGAKVS